MEDEDKKKLITTVAAVGITIGGYIAGKKIYDSIFKRLPRPDYNIYPGLYEYNKVKDILPREELKFSSNHAELQAYYYEVKRSKGLVVLVHGFHSGSDDYLPITMYLVKNGYSVFSYDGRGTYESGGSSMVGFCQTLIDLDNAINFLKKDKRFKKQDLYLLGHSCGGYAVTSVLNIHPRDVKACACIAAVNNCYTLILEKGYEYAGELASQGLTKDFLDHYQKRLFGKYCKYNGTDGINTFKGPVFVAHGVNDTTINYDIQSVISHRKEFTNSRVSFYSGTGNQGGHVSIWHSERSNEYQNEVDKKLKSMKKESYETKTEYVKGLDHYLYSEINFELFDLIIKMFDKA